MAGAQRRHRPVGGLVDALHPEPGGRRPRAPAAADEPGFLVAADRRHGALVPGARGRADRRVRRGRVLRVHGSFRRAVRHPGHGPAARHPGERVADARRPRGHPRARALRRGEGAPAEGRGGAGRALRLCRRAHRRPPLRAARRLGHPPRRGDRRARPALGRGAARQPGAADLRRHRHDAEPARPRHRPLRRAIPTSGACWASGPSSPPQRSRRSCGCGRRRPG